MTSLSEHKYESNIVNVTEGIILQGCNAQGVMGSGVAKQIRAKYPDVFNTYLMGLKECEDRCIDPLGEVFSHKVNSKLYIANGITQEFYGRENVQYVDYDAMFQVFWNAKELSNIYQLPVHIPYLIGAGLGGGDEKIILELIAETLYNTYIVFHHWK